MNKGILVILMVLVITSCASHSVKSTKHDYVGIWQFPEKLVWVEIKSNGQVYQCRIDVDGTVISSRGKLQSNRTIRWQEVWEPDQIRREKNTIYLKGIYGDFGFEKTNSQMIDKCQNPIS